MKKTTLLVTIAVCMMAMVACNKKGESTENIQVPAADCKLPIAYVNVDTIIAKYSAAIEANEKLVTKQESARADLNEKAKKFQAEANEFNRKLENNAFLSRERAEQEAQRLQKKQSDLEALEQRLTNELLEEQQNLNLQLREDINSAIKEFNKDGRYHLILTTSAIQETVLYAVDGYDISEQVLETLENLAKDKKK